MRTLDNRPSPATPAAGEAIARIRTLLPSLRPSEAKVAALIVRDPLAIVHLTVSDTAVAAGTSAATVVRCCQALGFRGFHDLKLALAKEVMPTRQAMPGSIEKDDPPSVILGKVLASDLEAIERSAATIDAQVFEEAIRLLEKARRILFVGVGTSAPLAQDAAYRFLTIGLHAEAPADVHVQHVAASLLTPDDACFAISHTGSTRETVSCVATAKAAGAGTLALTSYAHSPLTELSDLVLLAGSAETALRLEAMASRIAHLVIIDALYVGLVLGDRTRSFEALDKGSEVVSEHRY